MLFDIMACGTMKPAAFGRFQLMLFMYHNQAQPPLFRQPPVSDGQPPAAVAVKLSDVTKRGVHGDSSDDIDESLRRKLAAGDVIKVVLENVEDGESASRDSGAGMTTILDNEPPEVVEARKRAALARAMVADIGTDKVELVKLLQRYGVVVRGGREEAVQLIDALLSWKNKNNNGDNKPPSF